MDRPRRVAGVLRFSPSLPGDGRPMKLRIVLAAAAALLALASCAKNPTGPASIGDSSPAASSPTKAVERLAWTWNERDADHYLDLIAENFIFTSGDSSGGDSAGSASSDRPWTREDEVSWALHVFTGYEGR